MNGTILIVTGGILQTGAVWGAKEMGYRVVVTDRDPDCICAHYADEFHPVDIYDVPAHLELAFRIPDLKAVRK